LLKESKDFISQMINILNAEEFIKQKNLIHIEEYVFFLRALLPNIKFIRNFGKTKHIQGSIYRTAQHIFYSGKYILLKDLEEAIFDLNRLALEIKNLRRIIHIVKLYSIR
jgi:hypothetical protein